MVEKRRGMIEEGVRREGCGREEEGCGSRGCVGKGVRREGCDRGRVRCVGRGREGR